MNRVVITGLGAITPLGIGVEPTWAALCAGRSGVGPITRFDASAFPVRIAAELRGFNPADYIEAKEIKKMDTFIHYAVAAAAMAVEDAKLPVPSPQPERVGVYVGSGIGGLGAIEHWHVVLKTKGPQRITPFFIPMTIINLASGQIAIRVNAKGPNSCAVTACATGNHCIGDAYRIIQRGEADVMIAGGSEAAITPLGVAGFAASRALSSRNDEPAKACRPFDVNRDGFVLGEGAGIVVLESLDHARRRGANIYAELVGYGATADAYHITAPSEDGEGAARCMRLALDEAHIAPSEVGYINAHATSTSADAVETMAIKRAFGDAARRIPISSTKSMTGHLLGAAGGVEAVFTLLAMTRGVLPPTINYEQPDPACDLDYIPNTARSARVDVALSNSFGFGGTNACLLFRRHEAA
ncbi:MAG: beta-ketoacyl-ACP synthase II [Nitrospirae bacterium]|nr:beta-ketoacyl-ACP synthase II [Nitrospirota bacterium]